MEYVEEKNTDIIPDLSGANLMDADLIDANLKDADLTEANLRTLKVTADGLAEAKSLYNAKLSTKTETELREKHPERYKELIKQKK